MSTITSAGCDFFAQLTVSGDGAPTEVWLRYALSPPMASAASRATNDAPAASSRSIEITLSILGKAATRFNEASWLSFREDTSSREAVWPAAAAEAVTGEGGAVASAAAASWRMTKLAHSVGFDEVVQARRAQPTASSIPY